MKKRTAWALVFAALVLSFSGGAAENRRAQIDALIAEWEVTYCEEWGWNVLGLEEEWNWEAEGLEVDTHDPEMDNMAPLHPDEIPKKEALALALETVCEMRGIDDIGYFNGLRPFFGFVPTRIWIVSLLPLDPFNHPDWAFWIQIDAKTGELYDYRQGEPMGLDDWNLGDEPKG